jgi:hypothetical protein
MTNLDEKMSALAEQVLKRPLSGEEQLEIYRISDVMGMRDVQSFLHLLLVFKLHEDSMRKQFNELVLLESRLNEKLAEITASESKIKNTLESSIERVLGEGAQKIGRDMGDSIAAHAESALTAVGEYHSLRGQTLIVCFICIISALAYWLGTGNTLQSVSSGGTLEAFMFLPAGWCVFFCGAFHALLWACDHWYRIKKTVLYKTLMGLQVFFLSLLALILL